MEEVERRAVPLSLEGRRASGVALPYGESANVVTPDGVRMAETWEPGALLYAPSANLNRNHDAGDVLATLADGSLRLQDGPDKLRFEADLSRPLPEASGASLEFKVLDELRDGGTRTIRRAVLHGLALLEGRQPAYAGARAEVRETAAEARPTEASLWL